MMNRNIILVVAASCLAFSIPGQPVQANETNFLPGAEWGVGKAFIRFSTDGKVNGFAGCNRFFGNYKVTGKYLKVGSLGVTKKLCPARIMAGERVFLMRLGKVYWYKGRTNVLLLFDRDSELVLKLRRRDWD